MPLTGQRHQWTVEAYDHLVRLGIFEACHVELIQGDILTMPPMGSLHAMTVLRLAEALRPIFPLAAGYLLRQQMPLRLPAFDTEPEPDIAVVAGTLDDYLDSHPATALLVVEVAESSLAYDRDVKGSLYARAGITDYWIVNLIDRCLEVFRHPVGMAHEGHYDTHQTLTAPATITPLASSGHEMSVAALLPPEV
ncbi:MAG: Uma2 family endonuclease [bacterium]|nr:Uma2 family endonuclease [bacterium]